MLITVLPLLVDRGVEDPISGARKMRRQMRLVLASVTVVLTRIHPVTNRSLDAIGFW